MADYVPYLLARFLDTDSRLDHRTAFLPALASLFAPAKGASADAATPAPTRLSMDYSVDGAGLIALMID